METALALNDEGTAHMLFRAHSSQVETWIYDWLGTNQWEASGTLTGRLAFGVTRARLLSGTKHVIILAGGFIPGTSIISSVDLYDIDTQQW